MLTFISNMYTHIYSTSLHAWTDRSDSTNHKPAFIRQSHACAHPLYTMPVTPHQSECSSSLSDQMPVILRQSPMPVPIHQSHARRKLLKEAPWGRSTERRESLSCVASLSDDSNRGETGSRRRTVLSYSPPRFSLLYPFPPLHPTLSRYARGRPVCPCVGGRPLSPGGLCAFSPSHKTTNLCNIYTYSFL